MEWNEPEWSELAIDDAYSWPQLIRDCVIVDRLISEMRSWRYKSLSFRCGDLLIFSYVFGSVKTGGRGSTDYVMKGSLRKVPPELIEELKGICQVLYFNIFSLVNLFNNTS